MTTQLQGDLLAHLTRRARERAAMVEAGADRVRGLWASEYVLQLNERHTTFHLHYIVVQTVHQGCCYFDESRESVALSPELIGKSVFDLTHQPRALQIAALDAMFGSLKTSPSAHFVLEGTNIQKSELRAHIIDRETARLLEERTADSGTPRRIVMVGVVGDVIHSLTKHQGVEIAATDYDPRLIGNSVHGVRVESGERTLALVTQSDVAVVTGMTLWNGSLDAIIAVAARTGTAILLFAETGANFAAEYCELGVDTVVSEPCPFYLSASGTTLVDVYRRSELGAPS